MAFNSSSPSTFIVYVKDGRKFTMEDLERKQQEYEDATGEEEEEQDDEIFSAASRWKRRRVSVQQQPVVSTGAAVVAPPTETFESYFGRNFRPLVAKPVVESKCIIDFDVLRAEFKEYTDRVAKTTSSAPASHAEWISRLMDCDGESNV